MMSESDVLARLTRQGMVQRLMDNISNNTYLKDADARIVTIMAHTLAGAASMHRKN
jgi:hypothetical protein